MKNLIIDYLKLMRMPGVVGFALTPVIGALSVGVTSLSALLPLFIIGFISKIYGFVMNDYIDVDLDKLSKDLSQRTLVKGTISKKNALFIILSCFFFGYIAIFVFFYRPQPFFYTGLMCIILADILVISYNLYGKQLIGSDFFIALAESLFFLFGALMVLTHEPLGIITWIIFILVFNQVLYMNAVDGGLKDADHDYLMNVKNIALVSGVKVTEEKTIFIPISFKTFGMGIQFFSVFLVFVPFAFYGMEYELWQIILLILFVVLLLAVSVVMLNIKQFDRNKLRKLIGMQLLVGHSIVPIMLLSSIGSFTAFILIIFPMGGYVFFSILTGQKLAEPQI